MPKLGESILEGTITKWFVKEGDTIEEDVMLFEVATDKVDSEIPSPVDGVISKIFHPEGALVPVGEIVAIVDIKGDDEDTVEEMQDVDSSKEFSESEKAGSETGKTELKEGVSEEVSPSREMSNRFYSPLVRTIAKEEGISAKELESIEGSGANGRVQKKDLIDYLDNKRKSKTTEEIPASTAVPGNQLKTAPVVMAGEGDKVVEMDRVRKLIAEHMVMSKQVSPHVTSVVEADVTNLVFWREQNKEAYLEKYGEKITFMPFFIEATAAALAEFPFVNSSVSGDKIILQIGRAHV